jgi:ATP-binding cassette, subfamily F, member 3
MIRVVNLVLNLGDRVLFDGITFQASAGERIGLTGKNGAGKSTLLKMMAGKQKPDSGTIETPNNYTVGYLAQDLDGHSKLSVLEETKKAFEAVNKLEAELEHIQNELTTRTDYESDDYMELINQLNEKEMLLHNMGGQSTEEAVERILKGLGFESKDMNTPVNTLSGGWQMRIELAKILLQKPDLVLLDEPTNHLDIESIIWLEEFLINYEGTVILVSHDKAFLDNVTNRTIEVVLGKIEDYKCNYSNYLIQRQDRIEKQQAAKRNQDDMIRQTQQNIEKFRAKANKAKFAQSLIKKLDKLERIEVDTSDNSTINFRFQPPPRSGKIVVSIENVSKSFGDKVVLKNISLEVNRGEKIAFVGKNGMGKTTLAKMIVGQLPYDGKIQLGHNVELAYFAQHQSEILDGNKTVFQTIDDVAANEMRTQVRALLGAFLFSGEDVDKKVKVLSGGERNRLAMAKLLLEPANLLILDEPTNHLDIRAKDMLKKAIQDFQGTVIVVSHDRDFLEGLTEKVIEFKDTKIKEYVGDIVDFLATRQAKDFREFELEKPRQEVKKPSPVAETPKKDNKQTQELRKELRSVENKIASLEQKIKESDDKLKDPEQYKLLETDSAFFQNYEKLKKELDEQMLKWEELAEAIGE